MELRHIYTFQAIVKEGSFLRAAEKLMYAQSTITLHIQQLEAELGVKLFIRQGKKVHLTEAGRSLQEQADSLVARAMALQQTMFDLVAGEAGHVRIGVIEPTASLRLPQILAPFCQERPRIHLTLEVGNTQFISQRVASGALDLGICSLPAAHLGLDFEPLFVEQLALLLPEQHPLAEISSIRVQDLVRHRLLLSEQACPYRKLVENALQQRGRSPYSGLEIGSLETLKRAVQSGMGIALLPRVAITPPPARTILREIEGSDLSLPIGLVLLADEISPSRALEALLILLHKKLRQETVPGLPQAG
ncbi:MAG TPA: LysR family transcriptional regulator [Ktedonobacteraceae bacterium]|nr:LysR family transcriptional regulator [Ktedonobacteraceae bacterium]